MMAVDMEANPSLRPGTPRSLFRGRYQYGSWLRTYDVAPDGRFLMIEAAAVDQTPAVRSLRLALNWLEELKRLVPTN